MVDKLIDKERERDNLIAKNVLDDESSTREAKLLAVIANRLMDMGELIMDNKREIQKVDKKLEELDQKVINLEIKLSDHMGSKDMKILDRKEL